MTIQIAQRIEAPDYIELPPSTQPMSNNHHKQPNDSPVSPMDIDVHMVQFTKKNSLSDRDSHVKPRCFYCNGYGHVKKHCRKLAASKHHQNAQVQLVDWTSLAEVQGNHQAGN